MVGRTGGVYMFVEFAIIRRRVGGGGSGMAGELIHDGGEVSSISCRSVPILKKNINCDKFIKKRLYLWWKSKQRLCLSMVLRSHFCKKNVPNYLESPNLR